MGRAPTGSGRLSRARRALLPGRSPLVRTCDRVQGAAALLLLVLAAAALPAAVPAHQLAEHQLETSERALSAGRREVVARVVSSPAVPVVDPGAGGPGVASELGAPVVWNGLDGHPRTALVPVDVTAFAGDRVRVWVDDGGVGSTGSSSAPAPTAVPVSTAQQRELRAWGQVALATVTWWCALTTVHLLLGGVLDLWHDRWWTARWASTGPRWTPRA